MQQNHNSYIIIDYIYGGIEWNKEITLVNFFLLDKVTEYSKVIIIDSVSKNLSINGIKSCIVYSSQKIITEFEHFAITSIGSVSSAQICLLKDIYSYCNQEIVIGVLKKNQELYKYNFDLVSNLLNNTGLSLSKCYSGYYSLLGMPKKPLKSVNNNFLMKDIYDKSKVLVIPHNRYLYYDPYCFRFRFNLSMDQSTLIKSIGKLIQYYENSAKV